MTIKQKREFAEGKLKVSRTNLLLMMILTIVNIVLFALGSNTMLLFSATIPYFIASVGIASADSIILIACFVVAAFILLAYFFCWLFSKKHPGCLVFALIFFIFDILFMAGIYILYQDFSGILDVIFHIWILYYLIIGIKYGRQLKKLPKETEEVAQEPITEVPVAEE